MMMRHIIQVFSLFFLSYYAFSALAIPSPVQTLEHLTDRMLNEITRRKPEMQKNNQEKILREIVDQILVPQVDIERVARAVIGRRDIWQQATSEQRKEFINQFTILLINTYSSALVNYNEQKIQYLPLRDEIKENRPLQVRSVIEQEGRPPIKIDYRLVYTAGRWLVYDISVEGVSLVQSYREQFAAILSQPDGLNQLIQQLKHHNEVSHHGSS